MGSRFCPGPELFPDGRHRREALERAHRGLLRQPAFWLLSLTVYAGLGALALLLQVMLPTPFAMAVCLATLAGLEAMLFRRAIRRSLRLQLRERGELICIACGYDLVGAASIRCPECGSPINKIG